MFVQFLGFIIVILIGQRQWRERTLGAAFREKDEAYIESSLSGL